MITWKTCATQVSCLAMCLAPGFGSGGHGARTAIRTEFLLTLCAPLDALEPAESGSDRAAGLPAGWVSGPHIRGRLVDRLQDWVRPAQAGVARLDAEHSVESDDGERVSVRYEGVVSCGSNQARVISSAVFEAGTCSLVIAPTFQTESLKYRWLNGVQAIGKATIVKTSLGAHARYDIFAVK